MEGSANVSKEQYDVVIIGGGVAGMYTALKVLGKKSSARVLLVEREATLGGRARVAEFGSVTVPTGAGVGRRRKDRLLARLLRDLGISRVRTQRARVSSLVAGSSLSNDDVPRVLRAIRGSGVYRERKHEPFRAVARQVLGAAGYRTFRALTGYSDYERDSAEKVLRCYGMDDTVSGWTMMLVPWGTLIERLQAAVTALGCRILTSCHCESVKVLEEEGVEVRLISENIQRQTTSNYVRARCAVVAGTIETLRAVLPPRLAGLYRGLYGQPFIRVYARFATAEARAWMRQRVASMTVVSGPLQKVCPMGGGDVYMIAYSDNANARRVSALGRAELQAALERAVGAPRGGLPLADTRAFFWRVGTHGRLGLPAARQELVRGKIFAVGEALSRCNQGWTEGALDSVRAVLPALYASVSAAASTRPTRGGSRRQGALARM